MRNKTILLLIGLLGLFTSLTRAGDSMPAAATTAASSAALRQAAAAPNRGTLYRVWHQGNTAYLFGTIHVGQASFFPLEPQVTQALGDASKLVVELDVRNHAPLLAAVNKYGMYANDTIDKHLTQDSLAALQQTLQEFGIPFAQVARMKPWMATNFLISVALQRNGFAPSLGTEFFLLGLAQTQAKTVVELETADYQLSLFERMTPMQQEHYLRENLAEIQNGTALAKAADLMAAWGNADSGAFETMLREAIDKKNVSSEFFRRTLLGERNPNMATRIEALLRNDKITFVGVGLLHLIGENGVPKLLQQRGYQVQKLY